MAKKTGFDFSQVRNTPAVKAAEREITEGFESMSTGQGGGEPSPETTKPTLKTPSEITAPAQPIAQTAPQEPTQNINVPIPESLHRRLGIIKYQTKQNMKQLVVDAIREYVEKHDAQ